MNEKQERIKFVPIHLHINADAVEMAFMISSMLYEMPIILSKKNVQNRSFKKIQDQHEKSHFVTMESNKDIIYFAGQHLEKGDWERCLNLLSSLTVSKVLFESPEVEETIRQIVKETALKCYLILYQSCFENISLK